MKPKTAKRSAGGPFLCFGADVADPAPKDRRKAEPRRRRLRRFLHRIFRSKVDSSDSQGSERKLPECPRRDSRRSSPVESSSASDSDDRGADSMFSSSSSLSSSSSASMDLALDRGSAAETKRPAAVERNYGYAARLCLVLMSFVVMVFCGKLWAILWTSTWLCFTPCRSPGGKLSGDDVASVGPPAVRRAEYREEEEEEEKKRVVMEGFLERRRSGNRNRWV